MLKRMPNSSSFCDVCDLSEEENVNHFIMQCPDIQHARELMECMWLTAALHISDMYNVRISSRKEIG